MFGYRYTLINPHQVPDEYINFLNQSYNLWEDCIRPIAEAAGEKFTADDYFRADCVGILSHGENLVGSHLYQLFDLRLNPSRKHHFFAALEESTIDKLVERGHHHVLALEATLIHKDYRRSKQTIPWVEVLTGLGLKYLDESLAAGIIGTPRIDMKVDKMTYRLNAEVLQDPIMKTNCPCAVIYFPKQIHRTLENPEVQAITNNLWKNHINISSEIHFKKPKAA